MTIADYIVLAIIALAIGGAVAYIIRAKKSGQKCIGCPYSKSCSGGCNCGAEKKNDKDE